MTTHRFTRDFRHAAPSGGVIRAICNYSRARIRVEARAPSPGRLRLPFRVRIDVAVKHGRGCRLSPLLTGLLPLPARMQPCAASSIPEIFGGLKWKYNAMRGEDFHLYRSKDFTRTLKYFLQ
jgi:hypothetical protein